MSAIIIGAAIGYVAKGTPRAAAIGALVGLGSTVVILTVAELAANKNGKKLGTQAEAYNKRMRNHLLKMQR
jgi:hypothetical protein